LLNTNISQGNVATEFVGEKVLKIGQYLANY